MSISSVWPIAWAKHRDIGMLINTAGSGLGGLVADRSAADIARLIALNTPGVTLLAHVAAIRTELWERAGAEPSSIPPPL